MSNSLDSFLTRIGDVTIERVNPRSNARPNQQQQQQESLSQPQPEVQLSAIHNERDSRLRLDDTSDESSGDISDSELLSKNNKTDDSMHPEESEEMRDDDMDLDETIDSRIGLRESSDDHRRDEPLNEEDELMNEDEEDEVDDDIEAVNILENLPLEGAPIEGQEVSEADLLGKTISKELEDREDEEDEEEDNEPNKGDASSTGDDATDSAKRPRDSESPDSTTKKPKIEEGSEETQSGQDCETKQIDKKMANMRRNIREVMDETQLDEATLAAQRQEMERLRRVQEQQKILREVQRQFMVHKQGSKGQQRAVSLLQGKQSFGGTTISPSTQISAQPSSSNIPGGSLQMKGSSTVLMKVNSGSGGGSVTQIHSPSLQSSSAQFPGRPMQDNSRWQRGRPPYQTAQTSISRVPSNRANNSSNMLQQRIRMMTPSVSISPVVPKKEPRSSRHMDFFSDSECSDIEADEEMMEKQMQPMRKLSSGSKPPKSPKQGKELVTISSSSESSDDDCIVLSDPSGDEDTDNEDDPSNSGMHTNDRYNVPDEHGRVLVNVGHPDSEPDVFLAPQVARIIKPHQIGGVRFLYDNIVESIDRYKTSSGFGCILAHSMGLGKTLQVASFCDIFFRCTSAKTVLCIMPINTLQNWLAEFNMWLPYEDPNAVKSELLDNVKQEDPIKTEIKEENANSMSSNSNTTTATMTTDMTKDVTFGQSFENRPPPMANLSSESDSSNNAYNIQQDHSSMYPGNYPQMNQPNPYGGNFQNVPPGQNPNASLYPDYMDNNHPMSMYPNYDNYPTYPSGSEVKKEEMPEIKKEPKTETEDQLKGNSESKSKTPYSVDAPLDMETRPRHFHLHILNDSHKSMAARARVIKAWQKDGGVLMIGYELYRQLSLKKPTKSKRKRGQLKEAAVDVEEEDKNKGLLDEMHIALVNPGPDLVICDEGHRIKNSHASISLALKQMRTKRRIVLTGYPLQNNLLEYWCMVDFVRPNYLGTKSEFCNMFERPIQNGQCIDSTPQDIRLMRYRAHVLHALLEGFVQRRSHSVLQLSLPRKEEYILLVRMTPFQRKLYDTFMNQVVKTRAVPNPLKAFAVCCKIWNHPDILYHFLRKRQANEEDDLDLEETIGEKPAAPGGKKTKARQPKGESRKGKKAEKAMKNKPAASVQPNSSVGANADNNNTDNVANSSADNAGNSNNVGKGNNNSNLNNKRAGFQNNYPMQQNTQAGYNNCTPSNNSQQYQTVPPPPPLPPQEYSNYYPNEGNQEYGDFYNNNQAYQQYPANANYNSGQIYPNQGQNYMPANNEQRVTPASNQQPIRYPAPTNPEFRQEQQPQGQNYDQTGVQQFSRQQGYTSYPDGARNQYNQGVNQNSNYSQQPSNFQTQIPIQQEYNNTYPNQSQTFSQNNQANPPNNSFMNNQRSNANTAAVGQTFPQNQTAQNHSFPANQSTPIQSYPNNQSSATNAVGFGGPATQSAPRQQTHAGYMQPTQATMPQNQMAGYTATPAPQSITPNYAPVDQSSQHGYTANQQQTQVYQGTGQNNGVNYPIKQAGAVNTPAQSHRYPSGTNTQQPTSIAAPNQPMYPANQQVPSSVAINQNDSMFNCNEPNQANPNYTPSSNPSSSTNTPNHYPANATPAQSNIQNFASTDSSQNLGGQTMFKNQDEQYWQRNYQQPYGPDQKFNEGYFRGDANAPNRYPANYYPPSQNYQNSSSSFDYANAAPPHDAPTKIGDDSKPPTVVPNRPGAQIPTTSVSGKDASNAIGQQKGKVANFTGVPEGPQRNTVPSGNRLGMKDEGRKEENEKEIFEKEKEEKSDEEIVPKEEEKDLKSTLILKEDPGIPYDWATELMKGYVPGLIDASAKMTLFFCILEEAIRLGDRVLAFSQSLFTLNLIEDFLARNDLKYPDDKTEAWVKNVNYYRLDGSTSALEREKLINEFNANPKIHLFLVSTRAGSLGINLVGANRAIVFDASWNPCHDTQAVCRVYRYGQQKKCYVYRLVTDNCLERKIYDRQISKQGMADRVVDQCNPDAHLSLKEATTLSWDWEEDSQVQDFSTAKDSYPDPVMHKVLKQHSSLLTKQPFHHESLLVDRKDKKLSQAEKRLARRGYELEKMAANCSRPSYNYVPGNTATRGGLQIRAIRGGGGGGGGVSGSGAGTGGAAVDAGPAPKPVASVRPMQQRGGEGLGARGMAGSRWIPAEVWQRQGMSAQEMTLPLDVVIPTNSPDKGSIVLKAGQRVMVLKSPKGIYMQLESGKIIAIRTALKLNQQKRDEEARAELPKKGEVQQDTPLDQTKHTPQPKSLTPSIFSSVGASPSSSSPRNCKQLQQPQHSQQQQPQQQPPPPQQQQQQQPDVGFPLRNNSAISIIPKSSTSTGPQRGMPRSVGGPNYRPFDKEPIRRQRPVATAAAKPYSSHVNLTNQVSLSRLPRVKQEPIEQTSPSGGDNSNNSTDSQVRTDQRVEEVRLEDVVAEVAPHSEYETAPPTTPRQQQQRRPPDNRRIYNPTNPRSNRDTPVPENLPPSGTNVAPPQSVGMSEMTTRQERPFKDKDDVMVEDVIIEDQPMAQQPPPQRSDEGKNVETTAPPGAVVNLPKNVAQGDANVGANREFQEGHIPQYSYGQYPRYYDYGDPRSRSLSNPYGSYYPGVPPPPTNPTRTPNSEPTKVPAPQQAEIANAPEDASSITVPKPTVYQQSSPEVIPVVTPTKQPDTTHLENKTPAATDAIGGSGGAMSNAPRDDNTNSGNVSGVFGHPTGGHYPAPYPPGHYDPYAQHYPHAPANTAGYPPTGAPGYPTYGGPSYNADYARMYPAFHGPPPPPPPPPAAADPYIHHRGYAPPSSHPPNYYPPFPHPPPPYPNYSFLPPYPNPNVTAEPQQPPSQ